MLISIGGMNLSTIFYLIASIFLTHLLNYEHYIARKILIVKIVFGVSVLLIIVKESLTYSDATHIDKHTPPGRVNMLKSFGFNYLYNQHTGIIYCNHFESISTDFWSAIVSILYFLYLKLLQRA